jgi:hypothetical protein
MPRGGAPGMLLASRQVDRESYNIDEERHA